LYKLDPTGVKFGSGVGEGDRKVIESLDVKKVRCEKMYA
jgi:hypothetical protein